MSLTIGIKGETYNLKIGSLVRIREKTIWKGIWKVTRIFDNGFFEVIRYDENGKQKWSRIITASKIVEVIINPSYRESKI